MSIFDSIESIPSLYFLVAYLICMVILPLVKVRWPGILMLLGVGSLKLWLGIEGGHPDVVLLFLLLVTVIVSVLRAMSVVGKKLGWEARRWR